MNGADRLHSTTARAMQRRGILVGGTAALLAGAAIATAAHAAPVASPGATGDDAEIMRLAKEFWIHDAVMDDWNADRVPEEVGEDAQDRWWDCLEAMTDIRAATPEGIRIKAQCMLEALGSASYSTGTADDCVREFLADLAGRTAA
jgi:hypothetical protein